MPNAAAFFSYVIATTFTPGPNNILSMTNAGKYGFKNSYRFNIGIFVGFFIIMMLCNILSMTMYSIIPSIKPVMTFIGACYILYLAWKTYKSKSHDGYEGAKPSNMFINGLLLQFVNPKVILYGITLSSTFIVPYYRSTAVLSALSLLLAAISLASTCSWAIFGTIFQKFMLKNEKALNTVMSLILVYCAVSLYL
jgi:threonine/homoserine/homoserine lactone efflux protein